jgi:hypothetical protein
VHCLTDRDGLPCDAAFLSQAALTSQAAASGAPRFDPFRGPMRAHLEVCANLIHRTVEIEGWPPPEGDLVEHTTRALPNAQCKVTEALAASLADALRTSFDPASAPTAALRAQALPHRARLLSAADAAGSVRLDAMPTSGALTLSDRTSLPALVSAWGSPHTWPSTGRCAVNVVSQYRAPILIILLCVSGL